MSQWPIKKNPHAPNPRGGDIPEKPRRYGVEIPERKLPDLDIEKILRNTFK